MENCSTAQSGTLESNDIFIRISRQDAKENTVALSSIVMKQFGASIEQTIRQCLEEQGVSAVHVDADDRGALECTIKARMEAAIGRFRRMSA